MQASDTPTAAWLLLFAGCLAFTTFMLIVAIYVIRITAVLDEHVAGEDSDLAKIGWGLRAIDRETGQIPKNVPELNQQLRSIRDGLKAIDGHVVTATQAQQ